MGRGYGPSGGTTYSYTEYWLIPGPHTGRGPKNYQRSNDRITEDVNERLTRHGELDASNIQVSADNGEVTLKGTVQSRRAKRMAEDAAESVSGVTDVHNRLTVQGEEDEDTESSTSSKQNASSKGPSKNQSKGSSSSS